MKEMTPHAATMPEHTMNRRCVSSPDGRRVFQYRFIDTAPTTAQIKKEMSPRFLHADDVPCRAPYLFDAALSFNNKQNSPRITLY